MQAIGKIGTPVIVVIALVFAVGGASAMSTGQVFEGLLYFFLSCLVAMLSLILLRDDESESISKRSAFQNRQRDQLRGALRARLDRQVRFGK